MKTVLIWDWDNTLVQSIDMLVDIYRELSKHYGYRKLTKMKVKHLMNRPSEVALSMAFPDQDIKKLKEEWLKLYQKKALKLRLKKYVRDTLEWANQSGFVNIMASNKQGTFLRKEIQMHGLEKYFKRIVGQGDFPYSKPSAEYAALLLKGIEYNRVYVIGDGASDIKLAHNLHAVGILVNGHPSPVEFRDTYVEYAIQNLKSLPHLLMKLESEACSNKNA